MAIPRKDVKRLKTVLLLGLLALISCVANGADHLDSRRGLLDSNVPTFDITTFGVRAGGNYEDNAVSMIQAWVKACKSPVPAKVVVPPGTCEAGPVIFQGPCKTSVTFEVMGTLKPTTDVSAFSSDPWFLFSEIDHLVITGRGTFDGQGPSFWQYSKCRHNNHCQIELQSSLKFRKVVNCAISGFTSLNPPAFHMHVIDSTNFTAHNLNIIAPGNSPNTDGMRISTSQLVKVLDSRIGTGDDCVSIGQGSTDVAISNINCGPGHGISVGSLGKCKDETDVSKVLVTDCTLTGTTNGARIKTWRASPSLKATGIIFQNIIMDKVKNPIIIDQNYGTDAPQPSYVQLSDVHFKNIRGTSVSEIAVSLECSAAVPCQGVELFDIDLAYKGSKVAAMSSTCANAKLTLGGKQNPRPCY